MYCNYSQQWEIYDVSWGISEEANPDMHLFIEFCIIMFRVLKHCRGKKNEELNSYIITKI